MKKYRIFWKNRPKNIEKVNIRRYNKEKGVLLHICKENLIIVIGKQKKKASVKEKLKKT